jgi:hypothetical protein
MDRGFPRRSINITPQEELFDPTRILGGRDMFYTTTPTGETVLLQPRLEGRRSIEQVRKVRSIAPITEIPFHRLQAHLEASRDAEYFYYFQCCNVEPEGTCVLTPPIETFPNHRTIIRTIELQSIDGFGAVDGLVEVLVDGRVVKHAATEPPNATAQAVPVALRLTVEVFPFNVPAGNNVTVAPPGAVAVAGVQQYSYGTPTTVTLTANEAGTWVFDHWEVDLSGNNNPETIAVTQDRYVRAVYVDIAV